MRGEEGQNDERRKMERKGKMEGEEKEGVKELGKREAG